MEVHRPANLFLSTAHISTTASTSVVANQIGGWNNARQTFYFNVKMRQLLGDLWDKYDCFVLSLTTIHANPEASMTNSIFANFNVGGLNWRNSGYSQLTLANGYYAPLTTMQLNPTNHQQLIFGADACSLTFAKGDADVRLEFEVRNALTNALAVPTTNYLPTFTFQFEITPVDKKY
jgi:hypothetical protein